mmetsp:Transcript_23378/g.59720  ORF Transcript_23378/g.59720 Transcript_23378/m.59720 type:complete len:277 (+) Transcript_23378:1516-2346(+)
MQQASDRRILRGPNVCESNAEARTVSEDRILVQKHLVDEWFSLLLFAEHDHGQRQRACADDLLVLRVMGVRQQLLDGLLRRRAYHHESDGIGCCLAGHCGIRVEGLLQLFIGVLVCGGHAHQADAQTRAMLQHLSGLGVVQLVQEVGLGLSIVVVCMDDAHGIQSTTLRVRAATCTTSLRQICAQNRLRLLDVALVNDAQGRRRGELGPVGSLGKPLEVLAQEYVAGGATLHQAVGNHCAVVGDGVLRIYRILDDLQHEQVRPVIAVEEFKVEINR